MSSLPKVDQVLEQPRLAALQQEVPRSLVREAVRAHLDDLRSRLLAGEAVTGPEMSLEAAAEAAAGIARRLASPSLRPVINATGVVVHTNLGRSLLAEAALQRLLELNRSYSNLEYDLAAGRRGSRYDHVIAILTELTGAESALVVNNNAAAVCSSPCRPWLQGREVIVSRGQLVEIGGSFRIPEVMTRSGALLRGGGRHQQDPPAMTMRGPIERPDTALLLKVHTSNFRHGGLHRGGIPWPSCAALATS